MKNCKELLEENIEWVKSTFSKIDAKMSKVTLRSRDKLADGVDSEGRHKSTVPHGWTAGFWGALNCLLYKQTGNEDYLLTAKRSEELMDKALVDFDKLHHDVGFMWHILSGSLYKLTGDKASRNRDMFAAATLASRFVYDGDFIRAWNGSWAGNEVSDWSIIDCMMNLPTLYFASEQTGDDRFKQIAVRHADMAMRDHLRPDGSIAHIVEHDRATATVRCTHGGQGYAVGTCWSRGQAWGLYGFIISYIHTGDERYLIAAKKVAHYFISNCCDDWLPRVDFRAPSTPVYYDATAGACAACGLIEIAKAVGENEGGMYMNAAINILRAMDEKFMDYNPDTDNMLGYGTILYPNKPEQMNVVHISIIYGDMFYTEALLKLMGSDFFIW